MIWIGGFLALAGIAIFLGFILSAATPHQQIPMSYDEEVEWLIAQHGLSREEAEDIADIPWRRS